MMTWILVKSFTPHPRYLSQSFQLAVESRCFATRSFQKDRNSQRSRLLLSRAAPSSGGEPTKGKKRRIKKRSSLFRADRVLSNRGYGSRSECHQVLKARRIRIFHDGRHRTLMGPSERIGMDVPLFVDQQEIPTIPLVLIYHKPKWVLSVMNDPKGRPNLSTVLPPFYQNQPDLHPVGRLDYDTSGLLLFSSSGPLTQRLLHPNFHVEKEYVALVEGQVDETALRDQLESGVVTAEGNHTAELKRVTPLEPRHIERVHAELLRTLPEEYNARDLTERGYMSEEPLEHMTQVRLIVREGKHRMVRRMLANCGHPVVELRRDRQGAIRLGKLPQGRTRILTEEELGWAESMLSEVKTKKKAETTKDRKDSE